jgi:MFS family permease
VENNQMALVLLLWFALAINYVDRQIPYSIFPALKSDLGFTDARLGFIGSVFAWIYTLAMPFAGRLADLYRQDRLIVASMVLFSLATIGCSMAGTDSAFLFWRAGIGFTEALYFPAAVGMIASFHTSAGRSKALGIHQSAQFAGLVMGGWYGGWMADHVSWRAGFAVAGAIGLAYAAILAWRLPAPAARATTVSGAATPRASALRALAGSHCYLALCAAFFAFCSMLWVFYAWYPSHLYERFHLSMTDSGFNATVFVQIACGLGVLAGGALADRLTRKHPAARLYIAAAGILASAPLGYLTFAAETLGMARLFSAGYGFTAGFMIANIFASAYDVTASRNYGVSAGVLNSVGGVASAVIIFLAGWLRSSIGFSGLLLWVAVLCCLTALTLIATASRRFAVEREGD